MRVPDFDTFFDFVTAGGSGFLADRGHGPPGKAIESWEQSPPIGRRLSDGGVEVCPHLREYELELALSVLVPVGEIPAHRPRQVSGHG